MTDGGIKDTISWSFIVDYNGTTFANVTTLGLKDFLVKYNVPKVTNSTSNGHNSCVGAAYMPDTCADSCGGILRAVPWQEQQRTGGFLKTGPAGQNSL